MCAIFIPNLFSLKKLFSPAANPESLLSLSLHLPAAGGLAKTKYYSPLFDKVSKWFTLIMPIIVLFYEENGLGLKDIFLLKSVYSIVLVSLDIPTGYLADAWGRKNV